MNLEDFRRSYRAGKLSRTDLAANPFEQFENWLQEMLTTDIADPTSMILATVGHDAMPEQRYVLLKKISSEGFVFFTDSHSRKGRDIAHNPNVGLLFPWHSFERQVRVTGSAQSLDRDQVEAYFHSRPLGSQVAAYTSLQSESIASRAELEQRYSANLASFEDRAPVPERWGGYLVLPSRFEFWQGGENRLHDRFEYNLEDGAWSIRRLQP